MNSSDSSKSGDKKLGGPGLLLIILLAIFVGIPTIGFILDSEGNNSEPTEPANTESQEEITTKKESKKTSDQQEKEEGFSFADYIEQDKVREYEIVKTEDASHKALGGKALSSYSTEEVSNLAKDVKKGYLVTISLDSSIEEIKSTLAEIIKTKTEQNPEIDEVYIQAWESKESLEGGNPIIASADWSTQGEMGISSEVAKNNDRTDYKISYDIREDAIETLQQSEKGDEYEGLSEETRKEIYEKIVHCEDKADIQASKYYDPMCSSCSEFIENNFDKLSEKSGEIIKECKQGVRKEYGITEETENKIVTEAMNERWSSPELPPYPDCCDY